MYLYLFIHLKVFVCLFASLFHTILFPLSSLVAVFVPHEHSKETKIVVAWSPSFVNAILNDVDILPLPVFPVYRPVPATLARAVIVLQGNRNHI